MLRDVLFTLYTMLYTIKWAKMFEKHFTVKPYSYAFSVPYIMHLIFKQQSRVTLNSVVPNVTEYFTER